MGEGRASSSSSSAATDESPTSPQQHWLHRRTWSLPERVPGEDAVGARDQPRGVDGTEAATRVRTSGEGRQESPSRGAVCVQRDTDAEAQRWRAQPLAWFRHVRSASMPEAVEPDEALPGVTTTTVDGSESRVPPMPPPFPYESHDVRSAAGALSGGWSAREGVRFEGAVPSGAAPHGRRRSFSTRWDTEGASAESRARAAPPPPRPLPPLLTRRRRSSVWGNVRALGMQLARYMFSPAESSSSSSTSGYISYASSNSGSSGSDGERKKARKRISRSRRRQQQQQQRKGALDSVQASMLPFTARFSPVSRADSFGSVSSLGEEVPTHHAVRHSPQAANESSSPASDAEAEGDGDGDDLILPISSRSSTRWRAASSAADDVSSALESGTFKFREVDNGFGAASTACLPIMGKAGASSSSSSSSNNDDDDASVGARRCARLFRPLSSGIQWVQRSCAMASADDLSGRASLPRRLLLLLRWLPYALYYLWPVIAWLLVFNMFDLIPNRWKPQEIHVRTLPIIESWLRYPHRWFFFGYDNGKGANVLDFVAALPYTVHATLPFVFLALLLLRRTPGRRILEFARVFGLLCLCGVLTHLFLPAAPPWYYEKYGFRKPSYHMKGDPALLDRLDDTFGVRFYNTMYAKGGKVVFGTFPSLHAAWPYLMAMFEPQQGRFLWLYVLWVWWSALYLQHHYLVDLVGGAVYAEVLYYCLGRPRNHGGNGGEVPEEYTVVPRADPASIRSRPAAPLRIDTGQAATHRFRSTSQTRIDLV